MQKPIEAVWVSGELGAIGMSERIEAFRYFVRVNKIHKDKFVEFDFSINEPDLAVELVLPVEQFKEFCARYEVEGLSQEDMARIDLEKAQWRTGEMFRDTSASA